jgi:hypothetical protein
VPRERVSDLDVIFDVVFEDGLLFFELSNRSAVPARKVVTVFRQPIVAPDGVTDIARLNVFKKTEYLAPGKTIRVFVDSVASYFSRRQPNFVHVALSWRQGAESVTSKISHDIRIYQDLPYVIGQGPDARRGPTATTRIS